MSSYKILFQVSGSIAAYKSAMVISKLVQSGHEVQCVATASALNFIGASTLEGLTGRPVHTDLFAPGGQMDHINLMKWADLVILAPATANTINRLSQGLADDLIGALFLAHDPKKPYLLAPAMNARMITHPATQKSLRTLETWGVKILGTASGYLACGDVGQGKMLEPEDLLQAISTCLPPHPDRPKVLITAGGTREHIDAIRYLSNISSGRTAAQLADSLIQAGAQVTFVHGNQSARPSLLHESVSYTSSQELENELRSVLAGQRFSAIIHAAAVSDYLVNELEAGDQKYMLPMNHKLSSSHGQISLGLRQNHKLLPLLRTYSVNPDIRVVGFKLTAGATENEQAQAVKTLFTDKACDLVVANDLADRPAGQQMRFKIFEDPSMPPPETLETVTDLGQQLSRLLFNPQGENL